MPKEAIKTLDALEQILLEEAPSYSLVADTYAAVCQSAGISLECLDKNSDKYMKTEATVEVTDDSAMIRVVGPIDSWFGFSARHMANALDKLGKDVKKIVVKITSPGGDLHEGLGMYSMLRDQSDAQGREVVTEVHGLAASIAAVMAMAGDKRLIGDGSQLMIHAPVVGFVVFGNKQDVEKIAKRAISALDAGYATLVDVLVERAGKSKEKVIEWLDNETWFSVKQALDENLVTGTAKRNVQKDKEKKGEKEKVAASNLLASVITARSNVVLESIRNERGVL